VCGQRLSDRSYRGARRGWVRGGFLLRVL
jgi:hypothetical protein